MKVKTISSEVKEILELIPIDFGGGCSVSKASLMAWLIANQNIESSIDIGVYRGRSFFPQAIAHKLKGSGKAYGIDPYTKIDAHENDNKELGKEIKKFVDHTNFDELYNSVSKLRKSTGLQKYSALVRKTSEKALAEYDKKGMTFGLIHIDGNHDAKPVMDDFVAAKKVLATGGFIVMDDISWTSVKPTIDHAINQEGFRLLFCRVDLSNDYCVLTNSSSKLKNSILRSRLGQFSEF